MFTALAVTIFCLLALLPCLRAIARSEHPLLAYRWAAPLPALSLLLVYLLRRSLGGWLGYGIFAFLFAIVAASGVLSVFGCFLAARARGGSKVPPVFLGSILLAGLPALAFLLAVAWSLVAPALG